MKLKKKINYKRSYFIESTNLKKYIQEINYFKILTKEEESLLAKQMVNGDLDAREKLIRSNLRFVVNIAKSYMNKGVPFLDLINEGNIGLILACDRFDYKKGYRFISYAVWWIKQYIAKAFAEQLGLIRLPMNKALLHFKIRNLIEKYRVDDDSKKLSWNKVYDKVSKDLSISRFDIDSIIKSHSKYISFSSPVDLGDQKKAVFFEELLEDITNKKPDQNIVENEFKDYLNACLQKLSFKERKIISLRYGLDAREILSLGEIGAIFNVSKERIRQIEKKAIIKLKKILDNEKSDLTIFLS